MKMLYLTVEVAFIVASFLVILLFLVSCAHDPYGYGGRNMNQMTAEQLERELAKGVSPANLKGINP